MNDLDKALDEVFSLWIRCRGSWQCMTCPNTFNPPKTMREFPSPSSGNSVKLHCSHFWGKGSSGFWTRWDDRCAESLCFLCHQIWEKMKAPGQSYYEYKKKDLGDHLFEYMDWLSKRIDPMHAQVKEFRLFELISNIGSRGYPIDWLFTRYGYLIKGLPGGTK